MVQRRRTGEMQMALRWGLLACLTPLLVALWGGEVQAVTVEATNALRTARRCAGAMEGVAEAPCALTAEATLRLVSPGACAPRGGYAAVPWAEPDLSEGAILSVARAWAGAEVAQTMAAQCDGSERGDGTAAEVTEPGTLLVSRDCEVTATELLKAVTCLRPYAPRWRDADAQAALRGQARLAWWHSLPLVPGLVALVASARGLVRTRRRYPLA